MAKESIKSPADRAHMWERPKRHDEHVAAPAEPSSFPHQLPRIMHHQVTGAQRRVDTVADFLEAREQGHDLLPPPVKPAA